MEEHIEKICCCWKMQQEMRFCPGSSCTSLYKLQTGYSPTWAPLNNPIPTHISMDGDRLLLQLTVYLRIPKTSFLQVPFNRGVQLANLIPSPSRETYWEAATLSSSQQKPLLPEWRTESRVNRGSNSQKWQPLRKGALVPVGVSSSCLLKNLLSIEQLAGSLVQVTTSVSLK